MKTVVKILIKYSTSKCNKDLLSFLHNNINEIKKNFNLSVVIVYDDLISKLGNNIKRLPVLITKKYNVTGNEEIMKFLTVKKINKPSNVPVKIENNDDLNDFWNNEMHSNLDNDIEENDVMEKVKHKALEQTMQYKEVKQTKNNKKREVDNIKTEDISSDKISDMVNEDPIMKKFWENQESTPGFD